MPPISIAAITTLGSIVVALITSGVFTSDLRERVKALDALPVGSVVASMLKETKFNDLSEGQWVLADGRAVSGSDYARLTDNENVPDLRGQFLRGLDTESRLDPDGRSRALGSSQPHALRQHNHLEQRLAITGNWYQHAASDQKVAGHGSAAGPSYERVQTSGPIDSSGQPLPPVAETRPTNVAVNYFVKIKSRK